MRDLLKLAATGLLLVVTGCTTTSGSISCNSCGCGNGSTCGSAGCGSFADRVHNACNDCVHGVCDCDVSPLAPYGLCSGNHGTSPTVVTPAAATVPAAPAASSEPLKTAPKPVDAPK